MSLVRCTGLLVAGLCLGAPARAEFSDATSTTGLFSGSPSWGAQAVDMDADGDTDLFNAHHYYGGLVFTNDGNASFSVWEIPQILGTVADRHGYLWVDLDGDELLEVVCSHGGGGGCGGCTQSGGELWTSTAPGVFAEVPGAGGMLEVGARGRNFSAADVDGDGDLDLYHAKAPSAGFPSSLWRNDGGLAFVDVAASWGVEETEGTNGALFADWDDDGDPDLLLGGEEFARPTTLLRNDGSSFVDVTTDAFGALPVVSGADWGDYDGDGDGDLATCEGAGGIWDVWRDEAGEYWFFANHRFGDDGVDAFSFDTPGEDPVAKFRWLGQFASSRFLLGPEAVTAPSPSTTLTDEYVGAPAFTPGVDDALYCWRESPGGRWQVRVSAPPGTFGNYTGEILTASGVTAPSASNLETGPAPPGHVRVWRNDGGTFAEVTEALGLVGSVNPRHVDWVDFDNDGDLDLHLTNKGTLEVGNEPDVLWRNDGSSFTALSGPGWVDGLDTGLTDGGVWADFDRDGDLDVVVQEGVGPLTFTLSTPALYYRNDGPAGNWLAVTFGNTAAGGTPVGTKATAWAGGQRVHRRVTASSWRAFQGPLALHFGLGAAAVVDSLVVDWPDGLHQVLGPLPLNRSIRVTPAGATGAGSAPSPSKLGVGPVTPQPSSGCQELRLALPRPGRLRVTVHDVRGRRVATVHDGRVAGEVAVVWDGRDEAGRRVPAGVYFLRGAGDFAFARKAVRVR